jgi:tRNA threonylcarbamoyladenosine biosynthesis protein TsaB
MMRWLAIDASTGWGGAALLEAHEGSPRLVAETGARVEGSHAARLLPMVDGLLAIAGWSKTSLDAYAAVRGPGSFTGVRVALGLMSGMALAATRPCVGVGTLEAMAEAYGPAAADRVPLVDAGRGEVYGARFDPRGSPPGILVPVWVGHPALAVAGGTDVVVFGGGARVHEGTLREAGYAGPIGHAPTSVAAAAGRIAFLRLAAGTAAPEDLTPLYVRPADAEVRFR